MKKRPILLGGAAVLWAGATCYAIAAHQEAGALVVMLGTYVVLGVPMVVFRVREGRWPGDEEPL